MSQKNVPSTNTAIDEGVREQDTMRTSLISPEGSGFEDRTFTPFQHGARASIALTAVIYMISPEALDSAISSIYSFIFDWDAAKAPLFEAKVAVVGFVVPIVGFSSLHLLLGGEQTKASRVDGQLPTKPFEWLELKNLNLAFNPIASYLGSIWIYHQFIHPHATLPEVAPTFGVFAIELVFGVWLYDLLFFPLHYLMHKAKFGKLRKCHGYHHRISSHTLNALETVQHSYLDGFLQVAVNILVQQISPFGGFGHKHFLSRLAHNLVVTYLLTEAHSGYDLPWMSHRILPEILGGSPRHEKHHHDGRVYYQQYFKYLDDFFGFTEEGVLSVRKDTEKASLEERDMTAAANDLAENK
jgi:sterol desaturase/sphingolipid hydroxylase (fatty acid hydroxylase superfamily)